MSGKLIVFEGTDGSGKATQAKLLCRHLEEEGTPFREINFPRYGEPSAAMVQEYLDGNLGKHPGDVNAFAASAFFSMDRYASYKQDWGDFYESGGLIVADRYTTSNAVHQASKLLRSERKEYLDWLFDLEYEKFGLPKPDLVIYLDMPTEITERMMRQREQATGTHADGSAKGGVVVSIVDKFQIPLKYIGIGEGVDDLKFFDGQEFSKSLFDISQISGK